MLENKRRNGPEECLIFPKGLSRNPIKPAVVGGGAYNLRLAGKYFAVWLNRCIVCACVETLGRRNKCFPRHIP